MTLDRSTGRRRAPRRLAALAALAIAAAACSDSTTDAGPTTTGPATTDAPATDAPATGAAAASTVTTIEVATLSSVDAGGATSIDADRLAEELPAAATGALTQAEIDALLWMREEEKLAHDVYVALADAWGLKVFTNVSASEQTHTDAVQALLDRYGIADPTEGKGVGEFRDPAIQALHDELLATGLRSATDALRVGATIEDLDIVDLQARATTTEDINLVYASLELGSRNHLRAFTSSLEQQGITYVPQYLTPTAYQAIITSEMERGPGGR